MERHLTTKQVAELLTISHTTATKHMVRAGALDLGCGMKHSYRITEEALRAYLDSLKAEKPETGFSMVAKKRLTRKKATQADYSWALKRR